MEGVRHSIWKRDSMLKITVERVNVVHLGNSKYFNPFTSECFKSWYIILVLLKLSGWCVHFETEKKYSKWSEVSVIELTPHRRATGWLEKNTPKGGESGGRTNTHTRTPPFSRVASLPGLRFQARSEPCRGGPLPEEVQRSKLCAPLPGRRARGSGSVSLWPGRRRQPELRAGRFPSSQRGEHSGADGVSSRDLPGHVGSGQQPPPPPAPPPALSSSAFAPCHGRAAGAGPRRRLRAANLIPRSSGRCRGSPPGRRRRPALVRPAQSRARKWKRVSELSPKLLCGYFVKIHQDEIKVLPRGSGILYLFGCQNKNRFRRESVSQRLSLDMPEEACSLNCY
ncbi:uncharacterized protein [Macaca nemestrina]|uniref:uncharacterized protein n=1 Tax=Macaca nemestrina TaxID=9545 RepID=UPI0039B933DE